MQEGEGGGADGGGDFVEADAFGGEQEFGVGPGAPFGGVEVVGEGGELWGGEEGEEGAGRGDDGGDGDGFVAEGEEVRADGACGGG